MWNADLTGATLVGTDLTLVQFGAADLTDADLSCANMRASSYGSVIFSNTTCPDLTNSGSNGGTCTGHMEPRAIIRGS